MVEEGVSEGRGDGCKREPVGNGIGHRKEHGAVVPVSLKVEKDIGVDDPRDVVYTPRVIERVRRHHGKVSAVPNVGVLQNPILRRPSKSKESKERQGGLT